MILTGPISGIPTIAGRVYSATSATLAQAGDTVLAYTANAAWTLTLPPPAQGATVTVKKADTSSNALTVAPSSGTIDGASTITLTISFEATTLVGDGVNWWRI